LRRQLPGGRFKNVSPERSQAMRAVRARGNRTTEVRFRSALVRAGIKGWKMHPERIPGRPDLLFHDARVAVFVDGCFWHGCPRCGHIPKTNRPYWRAKIARNRARDTRITRELRRLGFSVVRLWECDLRARPQACLARISRALKRKRAGA
jgi:DNA mismatch endonuclease (patch repair protein)